MHELSLAMSVMKIVEDEARKNDCNDVSKIEIEIGTLSGVEVETFRAAIDAALKSSFYQNVEVDLNVVTALSKCYECGAEFTPVYVMDHCPKCNNFPTGIIRGKEFRVVAITFR